MLEKEGDGFKTKWEGSMNDGAILDFAFTKEEPYKMVAIGGG